MQWRHYYCYYYCRENEPPSIMSPLGPVTVTGEIHSSTQAPPIPLPPPPPPPPLPLRSTNSINKNKGKKSFRGLSIFNSNNNSIVS